MVGPMPRASACPRPAHPPTSTPTPTSNQVTFIEAMPRIMFFFDKQIAQLAERLLIRPRNIDYRTNVFASKVTPGVPGIKPVTIEMIDAKTKELVEVLEVRWPIDAPSGYPGADPIRAPTS